MKLNANARIFIALFFVSVTASLSQGIKIRDLPTAPSPSLSDYLPEANATGTPTTYKVTPNSLLGLRTITCTPPLLCNGSSSTTLGADRTLSIFGPNVLTRNVVCTGNGITDTSLRDAALTAIQSAGGGTLHLSGTCNFITAIAYDTSASATAPLTIEGDGRRETAAVFTSACAAGSGTDCIYFACHTGMASDCDGWGIRNLIVSGPSGKTLIHLKGLQGAQVSNLYTSGGDYSLSIEEMRYATIRDSYFWAPVVQAIKIIGESFAANWFQNLEISTSGSTGSAISYVKTGTADAGGIYFDHVVINGQWGGSGFLFSASTQHSMFINCNVCYADGNFAQDAFRIVKAGVVNLAQSYGTNQYAASNASALTLDNAINVHVDGGTYYTDTGASGPAISLKNTTTFTTISSSTHLWSIGYVAVKVDSTTHDVDLSPSFYSASGGTFTNDATKIVPSSSVRYRAPWTLFTGATKATLLGMINPAGSLAQYSGVDSSGVRKYYADNGTTVLETLNQSGAVNFAGAVTGSNLSGTNTGDQTITLTGDTTGSGTGSFATTLASAYKGWTDSGTTVNTTTSTDKVGIGTSSADSLLEITANAAALQAPTLTGTLAHLSNADGTSSRLLIDSYGTANPATDYRAAAGTAASSSAVGSGVTIGQVTWSARGTTAYPSGAGATINGVTEEAQTDSAHGIAIVFKTTPNGTASNREVLRIDNAGHLLTSGTAPGVSCTGTGTSPAAPTITGTDLGFKVVINTGTGSPASSGTCTVTYAGSAFANNPIWACQIISGASNWGNGANIQITTESTSAPAFTWYNLNNGVLTGLTVSTSYKFSCINLGRL